LSTGSKKITNKRPITPTNLDGCVRDPTLEIMHVHVEELFELRCVSVSEEERM
jgi:hypothetical protein